MCQNRGVNILVRAVITGFGLRLGSEVAKSVSKIMQERKEKKSESEAERDEEAAEDDELQSITPDPPIV
jgi:hypothetical protein